MRIDRRGARQRGRLVAAALFALAPAGAAAEGGFQTTPSLAWSSGGHRVDVGTSLRVREEVWDAFSRDDAFYTGTRARLRTSYGFEEWLRVVGELQLVRLGGMDANGTGALATYRSANDGRSHSSGIDVRQLYLELRPTAASFLRLGRQDVRLGGEVPYSEPDWRYLTTARIGERLIGSVGWSHAERAGDGVAAGVDLGGYRLNGFAARPTTGVFAVETAYRPLRDVLYGGGVFTVERGTWLRDTELSLFGVAYEDSRDRDDGGLADDVEVQTLGASWLTIQPLGPGKVDALLWAAAQVGEYAGADHQAGAALAEVGYQLPEVFAKPWLRAGLNVASGDDDPGDGDHETFFNLLPTNHLYYGFADQLAFQNLVNPFVQLRLTPHPKLGLNLFVHWFRLAEDEDARYAGTGAFDREVFGFPAQASGGESDVGTEYDLVASLSLHKSVSIEAGFSWLDGGAVFRGRPDRDVAFGYASLELRY